MGRNVNACERGLLLSLYLCIFMISGIVVISVIE